MDVLTFGSLPPHPYEIFAVAGMQELASYMMDTEYDGHDMMTYMMDTEEPQPLRCSTQKATNN
jgi:hypothetical protein